MQYSSPLFCFYIEAEDFGFLLPTDFPFVLLVNPSLERIVLSLETIFRSVLSTLMLMLAVVPKSISIPFFCIKLYIIGWCWYRVKDAKFCCFKDFFSEYKYAEGCDPSPIPSNFTTSIQKLMEVFFLSLSLFWPNRMVNSREAAGKTSATKKNVGENDFSFLLHQLILTLISSLADIYRTFCLAFSPNMCGGCAAWKGFYFCWQTITILLSISIKFLEMLLFLQI